MAVAVDNALPAVKERCDLVMSLADGGGVAELIDRLVADDLQGLGLRRPRKDLAAARTEPPTGHDHTAGRAGLAPLPG